MGTLLRTLAATAALTGLLLGTAVSTVLAATPYPNAAFVERYEFDNAWCLDQGPWTDCSVVDAALAVTITPDDRHIARINFRMVVESFDHSGVQIGSSRTVSFDRTVFADGGQDETFSVSHTRSVGEFGTCVSTYLFKIVDYDLQFEQFNGPGCS
jgi:hypothetical protein